MEEKRVGDIAKQSSKEADKSGSPFEKYRFTAGLCWFIFPPKKSRLPDLNIIKRLRPMISSCKSSRFKDKYALTLFELIVVISIVGILAVLTLPHMGAYSAFKLEIAAKQIVSDIRYVQNAALTRHIDTRLIFNAPLNRYSGEYYDTTTLSWRALTDPFTRGGLTVNFNTDTQYKGIDISDSGGGVDFGGTNILKFDWQGISYDGNDLALAAEGKVTIKYKNSAKVIRVTPQTGVVTVD
ncbi:MAG: type II secretion system protein [Candidatus Omnitrophota bacterium]